MSPFSCQPVKAERWTLRGGGAAWYATTCAVAGPATASAASSEAVRDANDEVIGAPSGRWTPAAAPRRVRFVGGDSSTPQPPVDLAESPIDRPRPAVEDGSMIRRLPI